MKKISRKLSRKITILVTGCLLLITANAQAQSLPNSKIIRVNKNLTADNPPYHFNTIQEAIDEVPDAGSDESTILVYPGEYTEELLIEDKNNLTIVGVNDKDVILTAPSDSMAMEIINSNNLYIKGMTIQNTDTVAFHEYRTIKIESGSDIRFNACTINSTKGRAVYNGDFGSPAPAGGSDILFDSCIMQGYAVIVDSITPTSGLVYEVVNSRLILDAVTTTGAATDFALRADGEVIVRRSSFETVVENTDGLYEVFREQTTGNGSARLEQISLGPGFGTGASTGSQASATGGRSSAFGFNASSGGWSSSAFGVDSKAPGYEAIAIGARAEADSPPATPAAGSAIAIGTGAKVNAIGGVAIGFSAETTGRESLAIGVDATVNQAKGIAIGESSTVGIGHEPSIAIGRNASTTRSNELRVGGTSSSDLLNFFSSGAIVLENNPQASGTVCSGYGDCNAVTHPFDMGTTGTMFFAHGGKMFVKSGSTVTQLSTHIKPEAQNTSYDDFDVTIPWSFNHYDALIGKGVNVDIAKMVYWVNDLIMADLGSENSIIHEYDLPEQETRNLEAYEAMLLQAEIDQLPWIEVDLISGYRIPDEALEEYEIYDYPMVPTVIQEVDWDSGTVFSWEEYRVAKTPIQTGKFSKRLKDGYKLVGGKFYRRPRIEEISASEAAEIRAKAKAPDWVRDRVFVQRAAADQ